MRNAQLHSAVVSPLALRLSFFRMAREFCIISESQLSLRNESMSSLALIMEIPEENVNSDREKPLGNLPTHMSFSIKLCPRNFRLYCLTCTSGRPRASWAIGSFATRWSLASHKLTSSNIPSIASCDTVRDGSSQRKILGHIHKRRPLNLQRWLTPIGTCLEGVARNGFRGW